jgi:hypothetical protein
MMEAAIKHQTTYYKTEMPGVMKDMEELEKRRLKEVERYLSSYSSVCSIDHNVVTIMIYSIQ